jgi:hypothetical protein
MSTLKSLPARPSLQSLSKQAKKLARHIAESNAEAIARALTRLPNAGLPLSHRDAHFILAWEYGVRRGGQGPWPYPVWAGAARAEHRWDLRKLSVRQRSGREGAFNAAGTERCTAVHCQHCWGSRQRTPDLGALLD